MVDTAFWLSAAQKEIRQTGPRYLARGRALSIFEATAGQEAIRS